MKSNKTLIIVAILLLNVLVVYMVGQTLLGKASNYEIKLEEARNLAEQDLCVRAIEAYNSALGYEDTLDVRLELLNVYEKALETGEYSRSNSLYSKVAGITEVYPKEPKAYEAACQFLMKYEKYDSCAELLMKADDLYVTSPELQNILKEARYKHKVSYTTYSQISSLYDNSYLVEVDGIYNHLDADTNTMRDGNYSYASSYSEGYAFVRVGSTEGEFRSYVIDKGGVRQCYLDGVTESSGVGMGSKDGKDCLLIAGKKDGRYQYYDMTGAVVFGDYVFAGRFRNNIAAVQEAEGQWKLINAEGKPIIDKVFEDVILNEFDECAPKGMIFAKSEGKYRLYNMQGKQVGDFTCDDAKPFIDTCTAFKSGDLWGFVNANGQVAIEPQFEDAKAFSKGIAGVKRDGRWSFINESSETVLEGDYEDVGHLFIKGKCFVKVDGRWAVLHMYYNADTEDEVK